MSVSQASHLISVAVHKADMEAFGNKHTSLWIHLSRYNLCLGMYQSLPVLAAQCKYFCTEKEDKGLICPYYYCCAALMNHSLCNILRLCQLATKDNKSLC